MASNSFSIGALATAVFLVGLIFVLLLSSQKTTRENMTGFGVLSGMNMYNKPVCSIREDGTQVCTTPSRVMF